MAERRPLGWRQRLRSQSTAIVTLEVVVAVVVAGWLLMPSANPVASYQGQIRTYYVAADEVEWNYTPSGMNEITGEPFGVGNATELQYTAHNATYLGTTLLKCVYHQYTNVNFTEQVPRPADQAYLGILGPVIYAEVGDTIHIVFRNNCRFSESMTPEGLSVNASTSGIPYNGSGAGESASVPQGGTVSYNWSIPSSAGPGPEQSGSTLWIYTSGAALSNGTDTGLVGPIVISPPEEANPNGTPAIPNIIELYGIFQEGNSPYLEQNILDHAENTTAAFAGEGNPNWAESLNKYTINGFLYGNQPMVTLTKGVTYQWDLFGVGADMHAPHWHGNTVVADGMRTDVVSLLPDQTIEGVMIPDDSGIWLFHCHVDDHLAGGMVTRYQVINATTPTSPSPSSGRSLAADYLDSMFGVPAPTSSSVTGSTETQEGVPWTQCLFPM